MHRTYSRHKSCWKGHRSSHRRLSACAKQMWQPQILYQQITLLGIIACLFCVARLIDVEWKRQGGMEWKAADRRVERYRVHASKTGTRGFFSFLMLEGMILPQSMFYLCFVYVLLSMSCHEQLYLSCLQTGAPTCCCQPKDVTTYSVWKESIVFGSPLA